MGIHEAIEIKENVQIGDATKTKSSITYQNFFPLYPKLAGMTGTAKTAEKEFKDIYNLEVIVLPTAKPLIRKDISDFVYQTELSKWKAVLEKSKECYSKGQPILIGTSSVEKSEFLSDLFKVSKLPHQILNAKPENITRESEIVAQAGEPYAITIATNMAGRGTDIILGGNPTFKVKQIIYDLFFEKQEIEQILSKFPMYELTSFPNQIETLKNLVKEILKEYKEQKEDLINEFDWIQKDSNSRLNNDLEMDLENLPYSLDTCFPSLKRLYDFLYQIVSLKWQEQNNHIKELGGLFVLATERHETRRIDNQLRGRAGRQGDPGMSQFYVSLDDELIKVFGGDSIRRWINYLMMDPDVPLESNFLTQSLEKAQKKVELYNYEIRKNVFQYDEVLNVQRKQLFQIRNEILCTNIYNELSLRCSEFSFDEESKTKKTNNLELNALFEKYFGNYSTILTSSSNEKKIDSSYHEIWISNDLNSSKSNVYQLGYVKNVQNTTLLSIIDFYWTEHIERMNYIRDTINWRAYGQQNPLIEYNMEAFQSYKLMLEQIRSSMLYYFLENPILK